MTITRRIRRASAVVLLASLATAVACTGSTAATVQPPPSAPPVSPMPEVCPHRVPDRLPRHAMPGVGAHLVPPTPVGLVICVSGSRTVVAEPHVARIARQLNRLERVPSPHIFACPADFGPTFALYFDYPQGRPLLVTVDASGCRFATNGRITSWSNERLLRLLRHVTA